MTFKIMNEQNKTLIAVPTFDGHIESDVIHFIVQTCKTHNADFLPCKGYDAANARNYIVDYAINGKYKNVLMIDSDTVPPPNALDLLLEGDFLVKTGTYVWSCDYSKTVASRLKSENPLNYDGERLMTCEEVKNLNGKTIQIAATGLGCTLIKTEVFKKIGLPCFRWIVYETGEELGEDLYFAEKCRKANIPIFLDSRILCGHIKKQTLYI